LIQRIVERVFSERGIARGANPASSAAAAPVAEKKECAAAASAPAAAPAPAVAPTPAPPAKKPEPPPIPIAAFVSEADVRRALTKGEKIYIGPKTIVTPAARDFGVEHEVLVETKGSS
jgi:hypothetical protein